MQGSEWLVPQVALLHTWAGEDQVRVNPYKGTISPIPIEPLLLLLLLLLSANGFIPGGCVLQCQTEQYNIVQ